MSNSDSEGNKIANGRVRIAGQHPTVEFSIFDGSYNRVLHTFGVVDEELPRGLYRVEAALGASRVQTYFAVAPGETVEPHIESLAITSAAPISPRPSDRSRRASVAREQAAGLHQLTIGKLSPGHGELVIFVRAIASQPSVSGEPEMILKGMTVLSSSDAIVWPVPTKPNDAEVVSGTGWAALRIALRTGGYSLAAPACSEVCVGEASIPPVKLDRRQSLWISEGWQTIAFIPLRSGVAAPELASIYMMRDDQVWDPHDSMQRTLSVALETVMESLRAGRRAISKQNESLLLGEHADNPMLAIAGIHSMLCSHKPDWDSISHVLNRVRSTVPGHPDVIGLEATVAARSSDAATPPLLSGSVSWPPTFLAAYRGLLKYDGRWPGASAIVEGSPAEAKATCLLVTGLWTSWNAPAKRETSSSWYGSFFDGISSASGSVVDLAYQVGEKITIGEANERVKAGNVRRQWNKLSASVLDNGSEAEQTVKYVLDEQIRHSDAPDISAFVDNLDTSTISLATGLPSRSVKYSIDKFKKAVPRREDV